ncbi:MAG TPA: tryptophan synthase subunit alpha [Thiothrix sp.]|nr:tryptophan synthase subunit alpha [Thiothrix sp.]
MSRIQQTFSRLKTANKTALIPYIAAGDPHPQITVPLMHKMVEAGADILELGVPFSDPMADGPTIQLACERALKHHTSLDDVLTMVETFRADNQHTPIVLMGYLNPIEIMGYQTFAERAAAVGVDGVLTVDLPPEEGDETLQTFKQYGLDAIFLLSPTTREKRIQKVATAGSGFVYYVSLKGVTGANTLNIDEVAERLTVIRSLTDNPVGVGFGIKDPETAAQVAQIADAVVVGSVVVKVIEQNPDNDRLILEKIATLLSDMRHAMDAAVSSNKI